MIDMHVHILPGVDDGAKDLRMTQDMMQRAEDAGITYMVCTPHVYRPEDQRRNRQAVSAAREAAHAHGIGMALGCEMNYRALARFGGKLEWLKAYCMGPTPCILLEFSSDHPMPGWENMLSDMADDGYLPIIAHPERYSYIQRDIGVAQAMCDLGCELQVDACGLMAGLLSAERKTARRLLKEGMVSYIASDAHRPSDYDDFEKAYRLFKGEWPQRSRLMDALAKHRKENGK